MKRNFLLVDTYSAMDWHDWDRTFEYIENGTFEDFVKKELNNDSEHKTLIYQDNTKEAKNSENSK